jgi:tetratricopeptide (TPR) repeat protein/transcriptional regulator with XRE-family HTH domain
MSVMNGTDEAHRKPGPPADFAAVLRHHRVAAGLSQEALAGRAGVTARSVRNIELRSVRHPRPETAALLGAALGLGGEALEDFVAQAREEYWTQRGKAAVPGPARQRAWTVPAQLPLHLRGFTGRADEITALDATLGADPAPGAGILVVTGSPGVGKTALAVHWAHRVAERFPDGQMFVNLHGFNPTGTAMDPAEAIRGFLDALDVPTHRIPADVGAQTSLYRSLVARKRMLVLLDNARDADQIRPLLPGGPGCLALVTSRRELTGLVAAEAAWPLMLGRLAPTEAGELLRRRLGEERLRAEPDAVGAILAACAGLPLALAIVAARAAVRPDSRLTVLAGELREAHARLDALASGDEVTDVRAVFSWSYRALTPPAARLFRLLGLHPGPDAAPAAVAGLAGLPSASVRPLLDELARAHLVEQWTPGRYALHDLLRAYATEQARAHESAAGRRSAKRRIVEHYLHSAYTADRLLNPSRDPITVPPPEPGVIPERHGDQGAALAWFIAEHQVLLEALDLAASPEQDDGTLPGQAWQLAWSLTTFLDRQGHWRHWAATQRAAVAAAGRIGDEAAQARAHRLAALALGRLGDFAEAHAELDRALRLYDRTGDRIGQAHTHHNLAHVWERQGRYDEALRHDRRSLELSRLAGHRIGQADALNGIGWAQAMLGDHEQALESCQEALTLLQELDNRYGQAHTWDSLGFAHQHLGHHPEALHCYEQAGKLFRALGDRYFDAVTLVRLGDVHLAAGHRDEARDVWRQALVILDDLDHPDAEPVRDKLDVT